MRNSNTAEQLSVGNLVKLKSGGLVMTVQGLIVSKGVKSFRCS
ncbi:DUF2158 domain-containing protein [Sphingobacterium hungaricum]